MATEKKLSLQDFHLKVFDAIVQNPSWRQGQAMFNVLSTERPDLSEQIRSHDLDPFYSDEIILPLSMWLAENWETTDEEAA